MKDNKVLILEVPNGTKYMVDYNISIGNTIVYRYGYRDGRNLLTQVPAEERDSILDLVKGDLQAMSTFISNKLNKMGRTYTIYVRSLKVLFTHNDSYNKENKESRTFVPHSVVATFFTSTEPSQTVTVDIDIFSDFMKTFFPKNVLFSGIVNDNVDLVNIKNALLGGFIPSSLHNGLVSHFIYMDNSTNNAYPVFLSNSTYILHEFSKVNDVDHKTEMLNLLYQDKEVLKDYILEALDILTIIGDEKFTYIRNKEMIATVCENISSVPTRILSAALLTEAINIHYLSGTKFRNINEFLAAMVTTHKAAFDKIQNKTTAMMSILSVDELINSFRPVNKKEQEVSENMVMARA